MCAGVVCGQQRHGWYERSAVTFMCVLLVFVLGVVVGAAQVSMEYLLREKLEKLVQGQIEARMASMKRDGKSFDASIVTALKV